MLAERGWRNADTGLDVCRRSPDGHAYLGLRAYEVSDEAELEGSYRALCTMYACADEVNGDRWYADFTKRAPMYLIAETVQAFSSTEPVERPRSGIPERNLPYVTTTPVPEQSADRRSSAVLARTPHAHSTTTAAPTGTVAPDPTPPVPLRRR